jgi:hypothetical protein
MGDEPQLEQGFALQLQTRPEAKHGPTHPRKAAEDLGSAAGGISGKYWGRASDEARHRFHSFQRDGKQHVRATPTRAALTVLGVRLILGLIFRR